MVRCKSMNGRVIAIGVAVVVAVFIVKPSLWHDVFGGKSRTENTVIDGNHEDDGKGAVA